ncbi:hypothetical protein KIW84_075325 [Lathyrus oleraceus]|uniref:Uncharacterized protein n=1 Tax=Pisum sativum TaxID=3888 RepID=A0A9D5A0X6_PEA|nr:hypothetical protein KIW84_075325 [Pisum sativum]
MTGFNNHEDHQVERVCLRIKDVVPGKNWITNRDYQDRTRFNEDYQDRTGFSNHEDYQAKWDGTGFSDDEDYKEKWDGTGFSNHEDYQAKRVCLRIKDVIPGKNWITNKDYQDRTGFYEDYQDGIGFSNHEDYQAKRVCLRIKDVMPGKNWITNKDYQDMTGFWLVKSNRTCKDEKRLGIYQGTDNFIEETRKTSLNYVMMHV